jgi:hypothetical protein
MKTMGGFVAQVMVATRSGDWAPVVASLTESIRNNGRKVGPEEATALLRVLRGPAHCRRCDYFGPYGEHTEGGFPDATQCASLASYGND